MSARELQNWGIVIFIMAAIVGLVISATTTQPTPTPPAPAMEWRVTDAAGETYTYPEAVGWNCVWGGVEAGAFRVECWRMADGREAVHVVLVAVRLEKAPAGDGAE